ncbi:MAG TPA: hypothetical protein VGX68_16020 [Thermoanaerobaculia bacterium]|jgi:hypothetical protein|nr:hypothetical protein [Thermoanaerobaculia bacterium]
MPKVALAVTTDDWEQLLRAAEPYADVKDLKVHLAELKTALRRLRKLEALRQELKAKRQRATQEQGEVREAGKVVAIQIRSILKGVFGPKNEKLVQFGMRPRRTPQRRKAKSPATAKAKSSK